MKLHATLPENTSCPHCRHAVDVSDFQPFEKVVCPDCEKGFLVPAEFGRFLLQEVAGSGQMGVVFKAYDRSVNMRVALKVAREELAGSSVFFESLMNEVAIAGRLKHRHLIQVYDYGRIKEQPYIAMEYISGGTLLKRMREGHPLLKERHILEWGVHVCEGLREAAKAGLVHGDLKPANLLFDHDNVLKIADFGLARASGQASNDVWGTPMYIAPEKAQGKQEDFRSDLYSLGIILWQALAGGTPPYDAADGEGLVHAHIHAPIPDLLQTNPAVSFHTSIILRRMMAKVPDRRFSSYDYAIAELRAAQKSADTKFKAARPTA